MKIRLRAPKLRVTLPFVKKDAIKSMSIAYYKAYKKT
jgi:hypothetical protein